MTTRNPFVPMAYSVANWLLRMGIALGRWAHNHSHDCCETCPFCLTEGGAS